MKVLAIFETGDVSATRWQWVQRCWGIFGLLLMIVTWRVWIPQSDYPQVPLLRFVGSPPAAFQWGLLAIVVASLVIAACFLQRLSEKGKACLFLTFVVAMTLLIVTDQHRLQPWAYQLVVYSVVLATIPSGAINRVRGIALLRILTISIYLFSALGKLDVQFIETVGQQFLDVALGFVGIGVQRWQGPVRAFMPVMFPVAELLIVFALAVPRFRPVGVGAAVILHVLLLLVLGPLGLRHQPGVLVWNLFFIAQVLLLFSGPRRHATTTSDPPNSGEPAQRSWTPLCVVVAVVLFPLLEPIGWCDHWPAWGLYSPRNSRAIVEIHQAGLRQLPANLRPYLANADAGGGWVQLNIDDWSLDAVSVPIYPQDRFQLGVAEFIATRYRLERTIRVRMLGMSNRWSGKRQSKTLTGRHQIVAAGNQFRLNSHPAMSE